MASYFTQPLMLLGLDYEALRGTRSCSRCRNCDRLGFIFLTKINNVGKKGNSIVIIIRDKHDAFDRRVQKPHLRQTLCPHVGKNG